MPAPSSRLVAPTGSPGWARLGIALLTWPLVVAATFLAVAPLVFAFAGGTLAELEVGAALVSVGIAAGLAAAGWAASWSVLVSVAACLVYLLGAVLHRPLGVGDLARGFTNGGAHLLSVTLPVAQPRWLMVLPVALCWLAGALAAELLVRRRSVGAATVAWLVVFTGSTALTAGGPDRDVAPAVALVAVAGGLLCCRRWLATASLASAHATRIGGAGFDAAAGGALARGAPVRRHMWESWPGAGRDTSAVPLRPLVLGAATLVLVATFGALVVPRLPGLHGAPVAPSRRPPLRLEQPIAPTDAVAALREEDPTAPPTAELTVRTDRPFDGYLGVAVLDDYNGDIWSFDRTFVPTGGRVPAPPGAPIGGVTVVEHVHLLRTLPFPWMPAAGRVTSVQGVAVDYAPASGMVLPAAALHAGSRYEVVSQNPVVTLASLGPAGLRRSLGGSPDPADLSVPESVRPYMGAVVDALAAEAGVVPAPTLAFLAAIETDLQEHYRRIDPAALRARSSAPGTAASISAGVDEGGTSFADVVHAVMTLRQATPEQYATLFALVAREEGIPARLVTDFRVASPGASPGAVGGRGRLVVTNRQAWTWVEVPVAGLGWLVADPAPLAVTTPVLPVVSAGSKPTTPSPSATAVATGSGGHALAAPVRVAPSPPARWWPWVVGVAGVTGTLALAVPLSVWARRRRRRARRRSGSASQRVLGAWHEMLDTLDEHGCDTLHPLTASEVAGEARRRFGPEVAEPVASVGAMADRVLFSTHAQVADGDAVQAWQAAVTLQGACRRQLSRRRRARALTHMARSTTV